METGQILVDNNLEGIKGKTLLKIENGKALADPEAQAEHFARVALSREHAHPSPNVQHIKILTFWLRLLKENEANPNPTKDEVNETISQLEPKGESENA